MLQQKTLFLIFFYISKNKCWQLLAMTVKDLLYWPNNLSPYSKAAFVTKSFPAIRPLKAVYRWK
jgi:hypothetical protein